MSAKSAGFVAAGATTLIALGLIGWAVFGPGGEEGGPSPDDLRDQFGEAPVVEENAVAPSPERIEDLINEAEQGVISGQDPDNPRRTAWEIEYERLEPQEGGRFLVTKPVARLFLDNGTVAELVADSASLVRPAGGNRPESGRFAGNVRASLYDAPPARSDKAPLATLDSESLSFDIAIGEVSVGGPVDIASRGIALATESMRIIFDETNRRLAYMGLEGGGTIDFDPEAFNDARSSEQTRGGPSTAATGEGEGDQATGLEQIYHAEIVGGVRIDAGGRSLSADRFDLFARLIDGELPADAIREVVASGPNRRGAGESNDEDSDSALAKSDRVSVAMTWSGALEVRPEESAPEQLQQNHLAARFTSPNSGEVLGRDEASGASLSCVDIVYGATTGRLVLAGRGSSGVTLRLPDMAETVCGRIEVDMTTGLGSLSGPGAASAIGEAARPEAADPYADPPRREISWGRSCDFVLATRDAALDLAAAPLVREVMFNGEVAANYDSASVSAEFARAVFDAAGGGELFMKRLSLQGGVEASAGAEGEIAAETIDVAFEQPGGPETWSPEIATATGRVRASREGVTLRAALAEARLTRDEQGALALDVFSADQDVVVTSPQELEAYADSLHLSAGAGAAELIGKPAILRYREASVTGGSMRIEEDPRRLIVYGDSVLNYSVPQEGALGYQRMQVECSEEMIFDDAAGRAEFIGDCVATAEPSDLERHVARAHRLVVDTRANLTKQSEEGGSDAAPESHIRRIIGYGGEDDAGRVEVESRLYTEAPEAPTGLSLERLFFAEGPEVIVSAEDNTLTIPGAGRILIENRTDDRPQAQSDAADRFTSGTTLLEWEGDLRIDRNEGLATLTRRVRLRQRPAPEADVARMECERLEARMRIPDSSVESDPGAQPELVRAEASGAVYAASGARQVIADRLTYDGERGVAEALAAPGNLITLFDEEVGVPLTGSVLRWDLVRDRIEWYDAGETTAPR